MPAELVRESDALRWTTLEELEAALFRDELLNYKELQLLGRLQRQRENEGKRYQIQKGEVELPLWNDDAGAVPTELTRSALFGLPRRGRRRMRENEVLASRSDIKVTYFGQELGQNDCDVWMAVLYIARGQPMGKELFTTMGGLLRFLKRKDSGAARKSLATSLDRLSRASITVDGKRKKKKFHAVMQMMSWGFEKTSGHMFVVVDPRGRKLFENLSLVNFNQHLTLASDMAKAVHHYASGHQRGKKHSVSVPNLKSWIGYSGPLKKFKYDLKRALWTLEEKGALVGPSIENDIVHWTLPAFQRGELPPK